MLPFSFEWVWDMTHAVFHGGLWFALSVIGLGVAWCLFKSVLDTAKGKGEHHH